jgi:hypothetical protein
MLAARIVIPDRRLIVVGFGGGPLLPTWVSDYVAELRTDADRRATLWPGDPLTSALTAIADELESRAHNHEMELLTIEQAAVESGYTTEHLYRAVNEGKIPNGGQPGAPRICRGDLPRKAGRRPTLRAEDGGIAAEILARRG